MGIADRYLAYLASLRTAVAPDLTALATIAVLMSAKLEQPISPSFNRMIALLPADKKQVITKK